jgi:hypothetical protein
MRLKEMDDRWQITHGRHSAASRANAISHGFARLSSLNGYWNGSEILRISAHRTSLTFQ